jgi:hypothetical protein
MSLDLTLGKYRELCETLLESRYTVQTIRDYLQKPAVDTLTVVLRHDVDRCVGDALNMAELEHSLGIRSTYYFRTVRNVLHPKTINQVANLGHEIGYHYETLSQANGDYVKAIDLFKFSLDKLRAITPIDTISMHGSPLSRWDNRSLWEKYSYADFDLTGEAYLSIDYTKIHYLNDTGRTWDNAKYNIRDKVKSINDTRQFNIQSTDDLLQVIRQRALGNVCISCHPNRWPKGMAGWCISLLSDECVNSAKSLIKLMRTG